MLTASEIPPECSCVELRGAGCVVAGDGQQFFFQSGFAFPWLTNVRVSRTLLFGIPTLRLLIRGLGRTSDYAFFSSPSWAVALTIKGESDRRGAVVSSPGQDPATVLRCPICNEGSLYRSSLAVNHPRLV